MNQAATHPRPLAFGKEPQARRIYSFEVFNDDSQQLPLPLVAQRARASADRLDEEVLRRSVPLPNRMRLRAAI